MALMVSLYCVSLGIQYQPEDQELTSQLIVDHAAAWEAFAPIAEMEFRPFRDAGWLRMEFGLSIQVSRQSCLGQLRLTGSVGLPVWDGQGTERGSPRFGEL